MKPMHQLRQRVFQLIDRAGQAPAARLERGSRRVRQVVGMIGGWIVLSYAAAVMAVVYVDDVRKYAEGNLMSRTRIETRRGDILDRNGVTLATSLRADSVSADPRWVLPPNVKPAQMPFDSPEARALRRKVAEKIARAIGQRPQDVAEKLNRNTGFVYLTRHVDDKASKALRQLQAKGELPGITLEPEFIRYYPNNLVAGALVGRDTQTGSIEASFDQLLRGQSVELRAYKDSASTQMYFDGAPETGQYGGRGLVLTIDEKIQAVAEHHLDASVQEFEAEHGIAIVLDVHTAEVLAMAVSPGINPNDSRNKPKYGWHNIAIENQYEPGSTFKVFTLAIALAEKAVRLDEIIPTGSPVVIGAKVIKDDHPHGQVSGLQALQVSSNIAMAKMAMRMEREVFYKYLTALGFGKRIDLGVLGEGAGQLSPPDKWARIQYANIAFGQGIAVTPLQMAAAYATVASGGVYRRPRLIRHEISPDGKTDRKFEADAGRRVFDAETARKTLLAMASVCQPRMGEGTLGGTGTSARIPSHSMGGKTGTAQQAAPTGGYSDTHWVGSFIGVTPIDKPRLVILVAIDTPKKYDPKLGKIARYGGIVAAPVVREIARFALPYLGVPPSPGAPYLDKNDPEKARVQDELRRTLAGTAADQLAPATAAAPALAAGGAEPKAGEARVPDLLRLPMRAARDQLAAAGLELRASGSGVGVVQGPVAGAIVRKGTVVHVTFRRLSESAEVKRPTVQAAAVEL